MVKIEINANEALNWRLQQIWKKYHSCFSKCIKNPKAELVHEVRTSLRRLIAILDIYLDIYKFEKIKRLRKELKNNLSLLRDLRDLQFQENSIEKDLKAKNLNEFKEYLKKNRKKQEKKVKKELKLVDIKKQIRFMQDLMRCFLQEFDNYTFEEKLKKILIQRYHIFKVKIYHSQQNDADSIHQARISFKKFRYTWEALQVIFPKYQKKEKYIKDVQDLLGEIQDSIVLLQFLMEFVIVNKIAQPKSEFMHFLGHTEEKHEQTISRLFDGKRKIVKLLQPF